MKARPPHAPSQRHRLELSLLTLLSFLALLLFVYSPRFHFSSVRALFSQDSVRTETTLPPLASSAGLFFVSADVVGIAASEVGMDIENSGVAIAGTEVLAGEFLTEAEAQMRTEAGRIMIDGEEYGHGGPSRASGMFPSPDKRYLAIEYDHGSQSQVRLLDIVDRAQPKIVDLTPIGWHTFLAWHPDSLSVLVVTSDRGVIDPGLWLVNVIDGTHERFDTPALYASQGILAAAFAPDGSGFVYAISNGIGLGSEVWHVETVSREQRQLFVDEYTTIGSLKWSPDGSRIAFVKLQDSPVAFSEAGLWLMNSDGGEARALAMMDGGHGQEPIWSNDGQELYYIARENHDNPEADYVAELLVSSIRSINVESGESRVLVPADGARQLDLSLTPRGHILFISDREGILEVWSATTDGMYSQLTRDGTAKRYPVEAAD